MSHQSNSSEKVQVHTEAARFEHDCEHCKFLGRFKCDGEYSGEYDLYHHSGDCGTETVIARYGRYGSYYSGLMFARPYTDITGRRHEGIPPLAEALRRHRAATPIKE